MIVRHVITSLVKYDNDRIAELLAKFGMRVHLLEFRHDIA